MSRRTKKTPLAWSVTPWEMNGKGGWKVQPIILVEGRKPFFADRPEEYIAELERLHDDPALYPGTFYTFIGQLKDGLKMAWNPGLMELPHLTHAREEVADGTKGSSPN